MSTLKTLLLLLIIFGLLYVLLSDLFTENKIVDRFTKKLFGEDVKAPSDQEGKLFSGGRLGKKIAPAGVREGGVGV